MSSHSNDPYADSSWRGEYVSEPATPSTEVAVYSVARREIATKIDRALMSLRTPEGAHVEPAHAEAVDALYERATELLNDLKRVLESVPAI